MPIASPPTTYQLDRPGCSGVACGPYLSVRDTNDIANECRPNQYGAICVRGLPTFAGYETTTNRSAPLDRSAFSDSGWFDTGDCGYLDEDGYLFITGRSKEIINRGGEVISPFDVEEAVLVAAKHRVKEVVAFSVEHDVLQETVGVVVVPVPGVPRIGLAQLHELFKSSSALHQSKWPFVVVYMDAVPKNGAGKPLRIKLASRLGLRTFSDADSWLDRHFEAVCPGPNTPLSEPIACSKISLDLDTARAAILSVPGVRDAAVRLLKDSTLEAFVSVTSDVTTPSTIIQSLSDKLPGYYVPTSVHLLSHDLPQTDGGVDFTSLEAEVKSSTLINTSGTALVICKIVAQLLAKEQTALNPTSDFFLLGGNSLLLGRLSYTIRKETGVALSVSDLFTNTTLGDIARLVDLDRNALLDVKQGLLHESTAATVHRLSFKTENPHGTISTPAPSDDQPARGQTHAISLIVQILPAMFFYPLKSAWTCECTTTAFTTWSTD